MIRYVVYVNGGRDQEGELPVGEHVAGRSRSADIHIPAPDVSGKHLKLTVTADGAWAENLSSHGTTRDGRPLTERDGLFFEPASLADRLWRIAALFAKGGQCLALA